MESQHQIDESSRIIEPQVDTISKLRLDPETLSLLKKMDNWSQKCRELEDDLKEFADPENKKTTVLVVGETISGKSTLVNGLVGVDLKYTMHEELGIRVIDCVNMERTRIGHTRNSETKYPLGLSDASGTIIYFDCCGFEDTKGAGDEIQNALYIQTLARKLKKTKVILTIPESKIIEEKNTEIQTQFEQMAKLFCNLDFLKSSLYLVVTKGKEFVQKEDIKYIEKWLRMLTENQANQSIREVIDVLIEEKRIGLFPKPSREGPVDQAIFQDIIFEMNKVTESEIGLVDIKISASAKDSVNKAFQRLNDCLGDELEKISQKIISQLCSKIIKTAPNLTNVNLFCIDLWNKIPQEFTHTGSSKSQVLSEVAKYADRIIAVSTQYNVVELVANCQNCERYLEYLDAILKFSSHKILDCATWNEEVQSLRRRIPELLQVSDEVDRDKLTLRGIVFSTAEIKKRILGRRPQNFKQVEVYCLNTIFLDEELTLPGVDLLIISPTWVISSPMRINLSGEDQTKLPEDGDNKDGNPGLPGGNSGNFVGIGKVFNDICLLKLILKGGRGGSGSNGRSGEHGSAGCNGDLVQVKNRAEKPKSNEISYGIKSIVYSTFTWNSTFHEVYESKGEPGGKGEDGGKGGQGGFGGKSGHAILVIGEELYELKGILEAGDGERGTDGAGGKGGEGGNGGKTYRATYLNDVVLPEFREKYYKQYWMSKSISNRVLNVPRTASRSIVHVGLAIAHVAAPVFFPVTLLQYGLSWHLASANSHWEKNPENCFELESKGESGETPAEKNDNNLAEPQLNNFDRDNAKAILSENYQNYYLEKQGTERFTDLIYPI